MAEYPKKTQKKAQAESEAIEEAHRQGCVLKQLTMFDCDRKELEQSGIVKCYPIPRVFRMYVPFRRAGALIHDQQMSRSSYS